MSAAETIPPQDKGEITFSGRLPALMLLGFVVQIGVGVWQGGQMMATLAEHDRRLDRLESGRDSLARDYATRNEALAGVLAELKTTVAGRSQLVQQRLDHRP